VQIFENLLWRIKNVLSTPFNAHGRAAAMPCSPGEGASPFNPR
jgi:hypothetical protein